MYNKIVLAFFLLVNIFKLNAQVQIGTDINGSLSDELFGWSNMLSSNGNILIVGAPNNGTNGYNSGQIKVFEYNGNDWLQKGSSINGYNVSDAFGRSVSINNDGTIIAVGSQYNDDNGNNSGNLRIYEFIGSDWVQKGNTLTGTSADDQFGTSVSISSNGNRVVVGAPYSDINGIDSGSVKVFNYNNNLWTLMQQFSGNNSDDLFGASVSISGDGNKLIAGAWTNNNINNGYVKVFENDLMLWNQLGSTIYGEVPGDFFGYSSVISKNGDKIAIGSWGNNENGNTSGQVEVYEFLNNNWSQLGSDILGNGSFQRFGWSISLSDLGDVLAVGAPQGNKSSIYKFNNGNWLNIGNPIIGENISDECGYSVCLSSNGNKVAIGSTNNVGNGNNSGHVRVYDLSSLLNNNNFKIVTAKIYPNPFNNLLFIESDEYIKKINVYNTIGQIVKSFNLIDSSNNIELNLSDLSKGLYFLELNINNLIKTEKIIKN